MGGLSPSSYSGLESSWGPVLQCHLWLSILKGPPPNSINVYLGTPSFSHVHIRRDSLVAGFGDIREDAADDRIVEMKPMYRDDSVIDVPPVLPFARLSVYLRVGERPRSFLKVGQVSTCLHFSTCLSGRKVGRDQDIKVHLHLRQMLV